MKVVCFNGSPKGAASNTEAMLQAFSSGFSAGGAEVSILRLAEKNIAYCAGCYTCWTRTPGRCVKQDDMASLIEAMTGADILIFGTPLYFNNVSGTLKVFFDRLTAAGGDPHKTADGKAASAPKIIMTANCGFPRREQFAVLSLWIKHAAAMMRSELIGEFYTAGGKALTQPTEDQRPARGRYLDYLRDCGRSLAADGRLSAVLAASAMKDLADF